MEEELEKLRARVKELTGERTKEEEIKNLKREISRLQHPKLVKFANIVGGTSRRISKAIGTGIVKGAKALNEADKRLAEEQRKQNKGKSIRHLTIDDLPA